MYPRNETETVVDTRNYSPHPAGKLDSSRDTEGFYLQEAHAAPLKARRVKEKGEQQ
jgi:hypothetical protein